MEVIFMNSPEVSRAQRPLLREEKTGDDWADFIDNRYFNKDLNGRSCYRAAFGKTFTRQRRNLRKNRASRLSRPGIIFLGVPMLGWWASAGLGNAAKVFNLVAIYAMREFTAILQKY